MRGERAVEVVEVEVCERLLALGPALWGPMYGADGRPCRPTHAFKV